MKRNVLAVALLFSLFSSHLIASDGDLPVGLGAYSKGMGGVGIALPQDALIGAVNPAGTGWIGNRIDTVVGYGKYNQQAKIRKNHFGSNRTFHSRPDIFLSESGYNMQLTPCLSWGLALWGRGNDVDYGRRIRALGRKKVTGGFLHYIATPTLAWKINCNHTIGIGFNFNIGRFHMKGIENFEKFSIEPKHVSHRKAVYEPGVAFKIGWMGQLTSCLTAGITYETTNFYRKFKKFRGYIPDHANGDLPQRVGAGFAYRLGQWVFASDLYGIFWKERKFYGNKFNHHEFGSKHGPGLGWKNQLVYKLGVAYDFNNCWTLRTGVSLGSRLISSRETFNNIPFNLLARNHWTLGATWKRSCHDFTAAFVYGFANEVKGRCSIPQTFGGGRASLKASSYLFALGYGRYF